MRLEALIFSLHGFFFRSFGLALGLVFFYQALDFVFLFQHHYHFSLDGFQLTNLQLKRIHMFELLLLSLITFSFGLQVW